MERPGTHVNPIELWRAGIPFEGDIDVDWFCNVPNAHVAWERLQFLRVPSHIYDLLQRGYGGDPIERMWRAVFRACVAHNLPLPEELTHLASELGVVIP